jgi:hypothetical protein
VDIKTNRKLIPKSFFFLPTFEYLNLLERESVITSEFGFRFDEDRPFIEFELLERSLDIAEAKASDDAIKEAQNKISQM